MQQKEVLVVGIDESNHGRYPEIFVAAYSYKEQNAFYLENKIIKERKHQNLKSRLYESKVGYNFLLLQEGDLTRIKSKKETSEIIGTKGIIIASLMFGFKFYSFKEDHSLEILIDGNMGGPEREFTRKAVSEAVNIPLPDVTIRAGNKFDEHILIVNYADELAHYLFRKKTIEELSSGNYKDKKRELIL